MKQLQIIMFIIFGYCSLFSLDRDCSLPEFIQFNNFDAPGEFGPSYILTDKEKVYTDRSLEFLLSTKVIMDSISYSEIKNIIINFNGSVIPKSEELSDYSDYKSYFVEHIEFDFYSIINCEPKIYRTIKGIENQLELFLKIQKYVEDKNINNPELKECLEKVIKRIKSDIQIYGPKK